MAVKCNVATHNVIIAVHQTKQQGEVTYFEDLTTNHNKTLVKFSLTDFDPPPINIFITIISDKFPDPITRQISTNGAEFSIQVENVRKVSLLITHPSAGGDFTGELTIQKTFCINC